MPTGVRTPVVSMSIRPLIGIVQALLTPGIRRAWSISSTSSSHEIRSGQTGRRSGLDANPGTRSEYQRWHVPPLRPGLQDDRRFHHRERRRVGRRLGAARLAHDALHLGEAAQHRVLPLHQVLRLRHRDAGQRRRHVEDGSLVQRRHELGPELEVDRHADGDRERVPAAMTVFGRPEHEPARRVVHPEDRPADRVPLLGVVSARPAPSWRAARASAAGTTDGSMRVKSMRMAGSSVMARMAAMAIARFFEYASGLKRRPS